MSCSSCQETTPIPECVDTIALGTIADNSTNIYIFVKNLTTGRIHQAEAVSSLYGLVTLDSTEPDKSFYNQNHFYEIWVTKRTETINDKLPITIDAVAYDCLLLSFVKTDLGGFTTHTISA